MRILHATLFSGAIALLSATASAHDVYVDNVAGDDRNDGGSPEATGATAGPVRTLRRGTQLAGPGDTLHIANRGVPYYESMTLAGSKHSGGPNVPFTVQGNGAVLDGSRLVPPEAWTRIGNGLWKFTPWRKGHYLLLLDDKPLPEHPSPTDFGGLAKVPAGHWTAWRGSIYFRPEALVEPRELPLAFAADHAGMTLYAVRYVHVVDLIVRHFRLDGVNAHDLSREVQFDNVVSTANGRSGLSVGGSSVVEFREGDLRGNRGPSVRTEELGAADVQESKLDEPSDAPPESPTTSDEARRAPS